MVFYGSAERRRVMKPPAWCCHGEQQCHLTPNQVKNLPTTRIVMPTVATSISGDSLSDRTVVAWMSGRLSTWATTILRNWSAKIELVGIGSMRRSVVLTPIKLNWPTMMIHRIGESHALRNNGRNRRWFRRRIWVLPSISCVRNTPHSRLKFGGSHSHAVTDTGVIVGFLTLFSFSFG